MAKETENTILKVARKQFIQRGFAATRMQEIADEAGINKAMLHYYFRSKEKLYQEIIGLALDATIPKFAAAMEQEGQLMERVEHVVDIYISTLIEQPDIPIFIMHELSQKRERFVEELKRRARYFPAVQSFMVHMMAEMKAGKIREISPIHLFLNIMGMTVFPFIAKPVFCTVLEVSEQNFEQLMKERKAAIMDFVSAALKLD